MEKIPIFSLRSILLLAFTAFVICAWTTSSAAAQVKPEPVEEEWKKSLYEKNIDYGAFACKTNAKKGVDEYFKTRPLNPKLPICHNDCPIISCRPVIHFPPAAKAVRVTGSVRVHILVENDVVLYARALDGHPLLRKAAVDGACRTEFRDYGDYKHQGIMIFTVDNYDYLTVPFTTNRVR